MLLVPGLAKLSMLRRDRKTKHYVGTAPYLSLFDLNPWRQNIAL